jgi:hypothetical protein
MMLIHRRTVASGVCVGFAHVRAMFRVPVIVRSWALSKSMMVDKPSAAAAANFGCDQSSSALAVRHCPGFMATL